VQRYPNGWTADCLASHLRFLNFLAYGNLERL
jgi:hypothetical protein